MSSNSIAFQGEIGANSHIACAQAFPAMTPLPCPTFEDALVAVRDGEAALAMIAIENSIAGRVADVHHLLPNFHLHVVGEFFLPIHFQLMAHPDASLSTIKTVRSHIHGLGQCRKIIRKLGLKAVVAADTAGSAREVSEMQDMSVAALAPRLAAEVYGLKILMEDVEDEAHNTTRFVVLSKDRRDTVAGNGLTVTSFLFRVKNLPAALYKAMGGFATNGVNMTKLESYMVDGEFTATQFLADIEGHPDDPAVKRAFDELAFFTREFRILGAYPAHPFRLEHREP